MTYHRKSGPVRTAVRKERPMRALTTFAVVAACIGIYAVGYAAGTEFFDRPGFSDPAGKCGYYINSHGQQIPRPCGNWRNGGERPASATAKCADGTWSWSRHPN